MNDHVICVNGIPSVEKQKELTKTEQDRIAKQIETLGPSGLKKKEEELLNAIKENEVITWTTNYSFANIFKLQNLLFLSRLLFPTMSSNQCQLQVQMELIIIKANSTGQMDPSSIHVLMSTSCHCLHI